VQSGENLYRIAKRYNISTIELANWNNIQVNTVLYACEELLISNQGNNNARRQQDSFTERSGATANTANQAIYSTYQKQEGRNHIVREGETIRGLATLYGYTEERFRRFNLLKPGEPITVGSVLLSTDCGCDRVITYEEFLNKNKAETYVEEKTENGADTFIEDDFKDRGGDYDPFYDDPQGNYQPNYETTPSRKPTNKIISVSAPQSYDKAGERIAIGSANKTRAVYMTNDEIAMLDEINLMRSNPAGYIPYIEQYKRDLQSGKTFGSSLAVCDELIAELRRTPPLSVLKPAACLYDAAKKHGLDQKSRGNTDHQGSDGSWPWDRVKSACSQMSDGNENLVGGVPTVRESLILLLVDDGIPNRGHRKTLLNKDWVYGTAYKIGKVGYMPHCWVQKFGY
jgi:uncharacterized protein YkwD/LysM repeat protein